MIKKWRPLLDRVIVLQDPAPFLFPSGTPGQEGFAIPDDQREKYRPHTGTVVAVGPGQWVSGTFCPVALTKGQHVMFAHPDTLTKIEHDGSEHLMMLERDVFLVLDEPEPQISVAPVTETKMLLIAIRDVYHIQGDSTLIADLDKQDVRATYIPLSNDCFMTSNGLIFRLSMAGPRVTIIPEQPHQLAKLFQSLTQHAKEHVLLAYVGPKV